MCFRATNWAIDLVLADLAAKQLLIILARCQNSQSKKCNPSIGFLCDKTRLSRRSVLYKLKLLEELGLIRRSRSDRHSASTYVLTGGEVQSVAHQKPVQDAAVCTSEVQPVAPQNIEPEYINTSLAVAREGGAREQPAASKKSEKQEKQAGKDASASARRYNRRPNTWRKPAAPPPRGVPIPADFRPDVLAAIELGLDPGQAQREALKFCANRRAKGALSCDWPASWQSWVLDCLGGGRFAPRAQRQSLSDYLMADLRGGLQ